MRTFWTLHFDNEALVIYALHDKLVFALYEPEVTNDNKDEKFKFNLRKKQMI